MKRLLIILLLCPFTSFSQNEAIVIEAEGGTLGADYSVLSDGDISYVSIQSNGIAQNPETADRVISYDITFPDAGIYELYIKFRIGPADYDDDSFFYGNGFGVKSPTENNDWQMMNNLVTVGYTQAASIVDGNGGSTSEVWKWLNFSKFIGGEPAPVFTVDSANQTLTFQIGAREDGLSIDKLAFAKAGYFYTVNNLENGEAGSTDSTGGNQSLPIADGNAKFLGNIYSSSQVSGFTNYWNQVTPENAGKWGSVEGTRDVMNWGQLDAAYALAKDNGFPFKLHVLIWGNQQPSWIANLPESEQLAEITEWFAALAERYPDMDFIEVVNEPLHDPPNQASNGGGNYINALGGAGVTGWDWVLEAFRMAREHFPNAELMLNDYNIVNNTGATQQYKALIELLQAENLIDQIGVQGHAFSTRGSTTIMRNNLNTLASTGLPIYVTELDIDGPTDATQLADYQRIFPVFWEHPAVQGVTLWGYRPGLWRNEERAYLIDSDNTTERPALIWLREYVSGTTTDIKADKTHFAIKIYHNPILDHKIRIQGIQKVRSIRIFDMKARLIQEVFPAHQDYVEIDFQVAPGIYSLQFSDGKKVDIRKVLVK